MTSFFIGVKSALVETLAVLMLVLKLSEGIRQNQGFRLFSDNWFSTLDLMVQLKAMGVFSHKSSTKFHANHLKGCPIASDKNIEKLRSRILQ